MLKRIEELEHLLATERNETDEARNRMEEAMASELQELEHKHIEHTKSL